MMLSDKFAAEATGKGIQLWTKVQLEISSLSMWSNLSVCMKYSVNKWLLNCCWIIGDLFLIEVHSNWVETNPVCICEMTTFVYEPNKGS